MRTQRPTLAVLTIAASTLFIAHRGAATPPFPPRNQCTEIPGHVKCFEELGGLIHGAEITTPTYTLTCRAFRQLYLFRYWGRKKSRAETREVVVAGVCEQRNLQGAILRRWDTLSPIKTHQIDRTLWESTATPLPQDVVRLVSQNGGKRKNKIFSGYYLPEGWSEVTFKDVSVPADYRPFSPLGQKQAWNMTPALGASVESPRFEFQPQCSEGFVVCSAYLKILHPNPQSSEIQVEMVSARRRFSYRTHKGQGLFFDYQTTFLRETFEAP